MICRCVRGRTESPDADGLNAHYKPRSCHLGDLVQRIARSADYERRRALLHVDGIDRAGDFQTNDDVGAGKVLAGGLWSCNCPPANLVPCLG
jgi:hypothetical protein